MYGMEWIGLDWIGKYMIHCGSFSTYLGTCSLKATYLAGMDGWMNGFNEARNQ